MIDIHPDELEYLRNRDATLRVIERYERQYAVSVQTIAALQAELATRTTAATPPSPDTIPPESATTAEGE